MHAFWFSLQNRRYTKYNIYSSVCCWPIYLFSGFHCNGYDAWRSVCFFLPLFLSLSIYLSIYLSIHIYLYLVLYCVWLYFTVDGCQLHLWWILKCGLSLTLLDQKLIRNKWNQNIDCEVELEIEWLWSVASNYVWLSHQTIWFLWTLK